MTVLVIFTIYFLIPFLWLIVASTKNQGDLYGTFGLWFAQSFNLFSNLQLLFTYDNSIYLQWLLNTIIYAGVGALVGTVVASMAGYAIAKYIFPGRNFTFSLVLGAILVWRNPRQAAGASRLTIMRITSTMHHPRYT